MKKPNNLLRVPAERKEALRKTWYFECPNWTEAEYDKWYKGLSAEEQGLIAVWNNKYFAGQPPYVFFGEPDELAPVFVARQKNSTCRGCPHSGTGCNACFHND